MLRWITGHRDVAYAFAVAALGEAELLSGERYNGKPVWPGPTAVNVVLILALAAPIAWRRRRPVLSAAAVYAVTALSSLALGASESATGFVLLIATTFAVAAYARPWWPGVVGAAVACTAHAVHDPSAEGAPDLFWAFGLAGIAYLLGRAVSARQRRIGALEQDVTAAERLRADEVAAATAAERAAIARELHDLVSHAVAVIVVQAQAGRRALPSRTDVATEALRSIEDSARDAMTELRRLLVLLDDDAPAATAPASSLTRLGELVARCRTAGVDVRTHVPEALPALPPLVDTVAFHVVREALTNAMRHAPGSPITVDIAVHAGTVDVDVTNDRPTGPGPVTFKGTGRGLIGVHERVSMLQGHLEYGAHAGGFRVFARLPLREGDVVQRGPTPCVEARQ